MIPLLLGSACSWTSELIPFNPAINAAFLNTHTTKYALASLQSKDVSSAGSRCWCRALRKTDTGALSDAYTKTRCSQVPQDVHDRSKTTQQHTWYKPTTQQTATHDNWKQAHCPERLDTLTVSSFIRVPRCAACSSRLGIVITEHKDWQQVMLPVLQRFRMCNSCAQIKQTRCDEKIMSTSTSGGWKALQSETTVWARTRYIKTRHKQMQSSIVDVMHSRVNLKMQYNVWAKADTKLTWQGEVLTTKDHGEKLSTWASRNDGGKSMGNTHYSDDTFPGPGKLSPGANTGVRHFLGFICVDLLA